MRNHWSSHFLWAYGACVFGRKKRRKLTIEHLCIWIQSLTTEHIYYFVVFIVFILLLCPGLHVFRPYVHIENKWKIQFSCLLVQLWQSKTSITRVVTAVRMRQCWHSLLLAIVFVFLTSSYCLLFSLSLLLSCSFICTFQFSIIFANQ